MFRVSATSSTSVLNTTTAITLDKSDPYDSISNAILYNSSVASISTNSEADGESSSSFLASQGMLYDTSSPPSLYLSPEVFSNISSNNSSITSPDAFLVTSIGTSSLFSSSSSSSNLSTPCLEVSSISQNHLNAAAASKSPPNEVAILYALQNTSAVSSSSSVNSTRAIHSIQPLHRHQRSHSFTNSSLSPCVSQEQSVDHRELSLTRKSSIASITSISSDRSSNYSGRTTPSTQIDQRDLLANVPVSRRGSRLLLTAEQVDELVEQRIKERLKELQKQDEWILVCDENRELQWRRAVTEKDKKIVTLVERTDVLEHSLNISSKQSKSLWAQLLAADNQYYINQTTLLGLRRDIEKLNLDLSDAKNQSAQKQKELLAEKNKIEHLLREIENIFGGHLEVFASKNSLSSASSTSSSSTSSASSDSAPITQASSGQPIPSTSSQNPQSSWWCVIQKAFLSIFKTVH